MPVKITNQSNGTENIQPRASRGLLKALTLTTQAFVLALGFQSQANAGIYTTGDGSSDHYWAIVTNMPDLDQQRRTATWARNRNGGKMYCGPTAAADVLSYYVQEGYDDVDARTTDFEPVDLEGLTGIERHIAEYQNRVKSISADAFIAELADEMNTGAFSQPDYDELSDWTREVLRLPEPDEYSPGTTSAVMVSILEDRLPAGFSVERRGTKVECSEESAYTITPRKIFRQLEAGNLVILNIGKYEEQEGFAYKSRTGGHFVVVTGVLREGDDTFRLWYRDPNRGGENPEYGGTDETLYQSDFRSEMTNLSSTTVSVEGCSQRRWEMHGRTDWFLDAIIIVSPQDD